MSVVRRTTHRLHRRSADQPTEYLLARIDDLEAEVRAQRTLLRAAEKNAARFHALLLAERIRHLKTGVGTEALPAPGHPPTQGKAQAPLVVVPLPGGERPTPEPFSSTGGGS